MLGRRERGHRAEQCIIALEIFDEAVAEALHRLLGGDEVGYRRVRCVKDQFDMPEDLGLGGRR